MEINNLDKNINLENNITNEVEQNNFLESFLGKAINTAVDIGIRAILPDFLEDQVINIKDNLLNFGLKDGIKKTIDDAIDIGKSAIGIFTGNFENINQVQSAVKNGGIIDGMSDLLSTVINKATNSGVISYNTASLIEQGKDVILNNIESNIEKQFSEQFDFSNSINGHITEWKENFNKKDFEGMEKEYNYIIEELDKLIPIENTIAEARNIEILHNLIKNRGQDFNLNTEEIELANKLALQI